MIMPQKKEQIVFEGYLLSKHLKHSQQRKELLDIFLAIEKHVTADEFYRTAKRRYPSIGFATVYRTLKLLCQSGLCREFKLEDGTTRYEHLYGHKHHDHLVCTRCGRCIEIEDAGIEHLQERLFRQHKFTAQGHRMELYGICDKCKE